MEAPPLVDETVSPEVTRFQEFLRIPSISGMGPRGSYQQAADWLVAQCKEIGCFEVSVTSPMAQKPIVMAKMVGLDPTLPCIVLNSHYDVVTPHCCAPPHCEQARDSVSAQVPVMREHWFTDPFAADIRDGYRGLQVPADLAAAGPCVYARGAQDMKCVCCQYLEAIRRLVGTGWTPLRTLQLIFVPDEEIGGSDGMGLFLQSEEFKTMKPIAFALDEGLANPRAAFTVFYGERTPWWLLIRAEGPTGHGSRFIADTAVSKLMGVVNRALEFRREQEVALGWDCDAGCKHGQAKKLGDVTTLNVTMLKGGVSVDGGKTYALNVIPTEMEAGFDVRISPSLATAEFKEKLDEWCAEEGLSWRFAEWTTPLHDHYLTETNHALNPFFGKFEHACASLGRAVEREIFPAGTDSRFLRALGIQAVGFSPMSSTPTLLHEHNEALSIATFMDGITVYETILPAICDVGAEADVVASAALSQPACPSSFRPDDRTRIAGLATRAVCVFAWFVALRTLRSLRKLK